MTFSESEDERRRAGAGSSASKILSSQAGRYELGEVVATGGQGVILDATDVNVRRSVAMKVLRDPGKASDRQVARFIHEARITGQLEHPGIVPLHELGVDAGGKAFYTMKMVQGRDLECLLARIRQGDTRTIGDYPLSHLLTIFQKICDAIAFAHARGVIHRDLKPANIMVGDYGEVLVMDWGLAKVLPRAELGDAEPPAEPPDQPKTATATVDPMREDADAQIMATMDGTVMGTPAYMAPEQALGKILELDERTDVYALGAILYNILTLNAPITGDNVRELLDKAAAGDMPTPTDFNPQGTTAKLEHGPGKIAPLGHLPGQRIPQSLAAVAMKALATAPPDRYQSVGDLQADVTAYQNGFATSAEAAGPLTLLKLFLKRHLAVTVATVFLSLALLAVLGGSSWINYRARVRAEHAEDNARREETRAKGLLGELQTERENLIWENYAGKIGMAQGKIADSAFAAAREVLLSTPRKHRNWEWGRLMHRCRLDSLTLDAGGGHTYYIVAGFSGDMSHLLLWQCSGGTTKIWDFATGQFVRSIDHRKRGIRLSPDSSLMLIGNDRDVIVKEFATDKTVLQLPAAPARIASAAISHDARQLLVGRFDGKVDLVNVNTGKITRTLDHRGRVGFCEFSRNGGFALTQADGKATVWDLKTGEKKVPVTGHIDSYKLARISPDGMRVLAAYHDMTAKLWNVETGQVILELAGHTGVVRAVAFSPDGRRALTGGAFGVRYWDLEKGTELRLLKGHGGIVHTVDFAPNGRWALSGSENGRIKIWDLTGVAEPIRLHPPRVASAHEECSVALSANGKLLLTGGWGKNAKLWNPKTGRQLLTLEGAGILRSVDISADGRWAITGSRDSNVRLWNLATGKQVSRVGHGNETLSVALSPDGKQALYGGQSERVTFLEVPTGRSLFDIKADAGMVSCVAFSPDGQSALIRGFKRTVLWDLRTNSPRANLEFPGVRHNPAIFFPDGRRVMAAGYGEVKIWDTETGKVLKTLRPGSSVFAIALSPDDRRAFLGCLDQTIRVWDLKASREILAFKGHSDSVTSLAISADGRTLVSGSRGASKNVIIWPALDWTRSPEELDREKLKRWAAMGKTAP